MSRIGKKSIPVPSNVTVKLSDHNVSVTGPKGTLEWTCPDTVNITLAPEADGQVVQVSTAVADKTTRAMWGTTRALIANMVTGVVEGYEKKLEIYGTGYNCKLDGGHLQLNIGFSGLGSDGRPQFSVPVPQGLEVEIVAPAARGESEPARFTIKGVNKQLVGQFAAEIRALRKPEPYKGKGIRYAGETVRRKQGKAFASSK